MASGRLGRACWRASTGHSPTATAAGQPQRFKDLYLGKVASVSALASLLSGSRWTAEDLAQNTLGTAQRQLGHRRRRRHSRTDNASHRPVISMEGR
jgi:hypothetical protein